MVRARARADSWGIEIANASNRLQGVGESLLDSVLQSDVLALEYMYYN